VLQWLEVLVVANVADRIIACIVVTLLVIITVIHGSRTLSSKHIRRRCTL
jgi:hypothetical protein